MSSLEMENSQLKLKVIELTGVILQYQYNEETVKMKAFQEATQAVKPAEEVVAKVE